MVIIDTTRCSGIGEGFVGLPTTHCVFMVCQSKSETLTGSTLPFILKPLVESSDTKPLRFSHSLNLRLTSS